MAEEQARTSGVTSPEEVTTSPTPAGQIADAAAPGEGDEAALAAGSPEAGADSPEAEPSTPAGGENRRGALLMAAVATAVVLLDQVTKILAVAALSGHGRIALLGDFLGLALLRNPGAAFSFATGQTWMFTIVAVVVIAVVVKMAGRLKSGWWAWALGLVLGGAIGNLIDRLVRAPGIFRGHVIDFIDYGGWFVGNVADIAIVVAAAFVIGLSVLGINVDGTRVADAAAEKAGAGQGAAGKSATAEGGEA